MHDTPAGIIDKLYKQTLEALKLPAMRERLAAVGANVVVSAPGEFGLFLRRELAQNAKVIKAAGLKAD